VSLRFLYGCLSPGSAVGQRLRPFVVYPPSCRDGGFYTTGQFIIFDVEINYAFGAEPLVFASFDGIADS